MNPANKETNPKDAVGTGKVPFSVIPMPVIAEMGLAMLEGARKYGRHNYRVAGVRGSVYFDAALRHLTAYWEGEDIDPDSGISHLVKTMACLAVWRDAQINNKCEDDRPPRILAPWVANANAQAAALVKKYSDPPLPFCEVDSGNAREP